MAGDSCAHGRFGRWYHPDPRFDAALSHGRGRQGSARGGGWEGEWSSTGGLVWGAPWRTRALAGTRAQGRDGRSGRGGGAPPRPPPPCTPNGTEKAMAVGRQARLGHSGGSARDLWRPPALHIGTAAKSRGLRRSSIHPLLSHSPTTSLEYHHTFLAPAPSGPTFCHGKSQKAKLAPS